jgi:hypothetical protein
MAATGFTPISLYYSTTASTAPTAGNLVAGELAINTTDGVLYYKDTGGVVQKIASKATGVVAGTTTQVIYNNAGAYAGSANMTFDGTKLTLANDASISGLTVGKGLNAVASNTAVGVSALSANTTGQFNTGIGFEAAKLVTTGTYNTALGRQALAASTTADYNTAIGAGALSLTTGSSNSGLGLGALNQNTTGSSNTAIGMQALNLNTTASNNTAVGYQAGYSNTTATNNVFVGAQTGYSNTTGTQNTYIGGYQSGYNITTGSFNSILGNYNGNAYGLDIRTASGYIVLSDGYGNPRQAIDSNGAVLFNAASASPNPANGIVMTPYNGTSGNYIAIGHATSTPSGNGWLTFSYNGTIIGSVTQNGTTATLFNTTSDYRLKTDIAPITNALSTVEALNPVSFTWTDGRKDDGFIAHELQTVIPNCVTGEKDAVNEDGTPKYQQMDNSGVIPFLVKAIQEQQALIKDLTTRLTALEGK